MNATALQSLPRLGDSSAEWASRLGRPAAVVNNGYGIVRRFHFDGDELTVFFDHDHAMAVYCPYDSTGVDRGLLVSRNSRADKPRLLIGDYGWIIATPDCPGVCIRALAGVARRVRGE